MLIDDERDLRDGLRALGAAAPAPPAERVDASVRRATAIRRRRVATATVVAAAVLVPVAVLGSGVVRAPEPDLTSPAAWPDRRTPGLTAYSDKALADWTDRNTLHEGETARWLYSARVPRTEKVAVVFATCVEKACSRIVLLAAKETEAQLDDLDPEQSPWNGYTMPLDERAPVPVLSTYLDEAPRDTENGPANVLFVFAGPRGERATWRSPARRPGTGGEGELAALNGAFWGAAGYLSAPATVTLRDAKGRAAADVVVGEREASLDDVNELPNVRWPEPLEPVAGYRFIAESRGHFSSRSGGEMQDEDAPAYTVFVRCIADRAVEVITGGKTYQAECDGVSRQVTGDIPVVRGHVMVDINPMDSYTALAYAIGVRD